MSSGAVNFNVIFVHMAIARDEHVLVLDSGVGAVIDDPSACSILRHTAKITAHDDHMLVAFGGRVTAAQTFVLGNRGRRVARHLFAAKQCARLSSHGNFPQVVFTHARRRQAADALMIVQNLATGRRVARRIVPGTVRGLNLHRRRENSHEGRAEVIALKLDFLSTDRARLFASGARNCKKLWRAVAAHRARRGRLH